MEKPEPQFWDLVEENRSALGRFAYALTGSKDDAKDLVSETVLAAHKSFPKLQNINGFRKSLYTIARRIHRKKIWRKRIFSPLEVASHFEDDVRTESAHDIMVLLLALEKLPTKQREAVLRQKLEVLNALLPHVGSFGGRNPFGNMAYESKPFCLRCIRNRVGGLLGQMIVNFYEIDTERGE